MEGQDVDPDMPERSGLTGSAVPNLRMAAMHLALKQNTASRIQRDSQPTSLRQPIC
jgi:hypothetical protein